MNRDYRVTNQGPVNVRGREFAPGSNVRLNPADDTTTCLIDGGWVVPAKLTTADVREYAARLLERHGWTPDVTPAGRTPYNVYRALEKAVQELGVPTMRMQAVRELRSELGIRSLFEDPARPTTRDGWVAALLALRGQVTCPVQDDPRDAPAEDEAAIDALLACPYTSADECATARERSVAGVSDTIPGCLVHGTGR